MLKDYLKKHNLSLYSLSKLSGIPYSTLNDLSNGKVNIDNCKVSVLKGIASVLGVSLVEAYDICSANQAPFKTSDGMDTFVSVRNKNFFCEFEYNQQSVEIELCKVNEDTKFYIEEIAKWRTEEYIRTRRMKEFE